MKKSTIATLIVFLVLIPATLLLGRSLSGRSYYITSTLVIVEILVPFIMAFEGRKPQARELVVIAVMCAIAVAMSIFGAACVLLIVGPLLDTCSVFLTLTEITPKTAWPLYLSGLPVNASQAACTFITILLLGEPLLEKLDRVKLKFGLTE